MLDQAAVAFSASQHAALIAWSAEPPLGLDVRLTIDPEEAFEVAEIYHRDTKLTLRMLFAINRGKWETDSVRAALDKVLEQAKGRPVFLESTT